MQMVRHGLYLALKKPVYILKQADYNPTMDAEMYKLAVYENSITLFFTTVTVVGVAVGTGSLHCLWGLLMLLNINLVRS